MANVKNIVKVMNFHSLVRVDKAKRDAEKFRNVDIELDKILYQLLNNRNLKLDKKMLLTNENGITINIYIANDMGFCADFNSSIKKAMMDDKDSYKIIIGKKVFPEKKNDAVLLELKKKEYLSDYQKIDKVIYENIKKGNIKEVNVIYNRYINVNDIVLDKKRIYPLEIDDQKYPDVPVTSDFVIETDISELFSNIVSLLLCYQVQILERSSWASENVMREKVTRESSKKIEEIENIKKQMARKEKHDKDFKKQLNMIRNLAKEE